MEQNNILHITDIDAPCLQVYTKCSEVQLKHYFEPRGGIFIAESPTVISLALDAGYRPLSLLVPRKDVEGAAREIICRVGEIPVYVADEQLLEQITGFHMIRGAMCALHRTPLVDVETLVSGKKRIAVLDEVENPTNVGAIIRSAAALHMDAVLLTDRCSDPLYRRAARVSMGTVFQIPWTVLNKEESRNYPDLLRRLGFTSVAMALRDRSLRIDDPILQEKEKIAVILGSEGYGLDEEMIDRCDHTVKIPMSHGVDSLNVAAASAVAFWQMRKEK